MNVLGTQFTVYDDGCHPSKEVPDDELREELISIIYVIFYRIIMTYFNKIN